MMEPKGRQSGETNGMAWELWAQELDSAFYDQSNDMKVSIIEFDKHPESADPAAPPQPDMQIQLQKGMRVICFAIKNLRKEESKDVKGSDIIVVPSV